MNKRGHLESQSDKILEAYDNGAFTKELCTQFGVNYPPSMIKFLRKNGREPRGYKTKEGNILSTVDAAYLAGLIDGEGCIRAAFSNAVRGTVVDYRVVIQLVTPEVLLWAKEVTGLGYLHERKRPVNENWRTLTSWSVTGQGVKSFLCQIQPYLRIKKKQAELVIEFCEIVRTQKNNGVDAVERQKEIVEAIKYLNKRGLN